MESVIGRTRSRVGLLGLLALVCLPRCACDDDLDQLIPDIVVVPERIELGQRSLSEATTWLFQIGNEGTGPLVLTEITIEAFDDPDSAPGEWLDTAGAAFSVMTAPEQVAPDDVEEGQILFTPSDRGRFGGTLVIRSDDPDEPEVRVPLIGEGGGPLIEAIPEALDFETVNEGPGSLKQLQLKNVGFDFLNITDIYLESELSLDAGALGSPFSLDDDVDTNRTLTVDQVITVDVRMDPTRAQVEAAGGPLSDTLVIVSDALNAPNLRVPLTGDVNLAPTAVAVELDSRLSEVKVDIGREVIVDGSDTVDPEGDAFTFTWSLAASPDEQATLFPGLIGPECTSDAACDGAMGYRCIAGSGGAAARCRQVAWTHLVPYLPGTYAVRLRATDEHGAFSEADCTILPRDFALVLRWEAEPGSICTTFTEAECDALDPEEQFCPCDQSDLDLHFLRPAGGMVDGGVAEGGLCDLGECPAGCLDPGPPVENLCVEESDAHVDTCRQTGADCSTQNRYPEWGEPGRLDDPRLDVDDVRGLGPEIITMDNPANGTYTAAVHYYLDRIAAEPSMASLDVYVKGELVETIGPQRMEEGDVWYAATLTRTGGPTDDGTWSVQSLPAETLSLGTDVCGY